MFSIEYAAVADGSPGAKKLLVPSRAWQDFEAHALPLEIPLPPACEGIALLQASLREGMLEHVRREVSRVKALSVSDIMTAVSSVFIEEVMSS